MLYLVYLPSSREPNADGELDAEFAILRAENERHARELFIVEQCLQAIDHDRIAVSEITLDGEALAVLASGDGVVYPEVLR